MLTDAPLTPIPGDYDRKWISDDYFDLIVWFDSGNRIHGFQLLYDRDNEAKALTYRNGQRLAAQYVDLGEDNPAKNQTPVVGSALEFDRATLLAEFDRRGRRLPRRIRRFVANVIRYGRPSPIAAWIPGVLVFATLLWIVRIATAEPDVGASTSRDNIQ